MGKVYTGASMSLDGYISGPSETGFEHLFKWYGNGDVAVPTSKPGMTFQMSEASARHFGGMVAETGALVVGRKLFDSTGGWGGEHPMGVPVVVLTHSVPEGWPRVDGPFTFVTDGIEHAVETAKALAGDKVVGVNGGTIVCPGNPGGTVIGVLARAVDAPTAGGCSVADEQSASS